MAVSSLDIHISNPVVLSFRPVGESCFPFEVFIEGTERMREAITIISGNTTPGRKERLLKGVDEKTALWVH
jgi:hypothetical protein